jgi:hypothetical protein
MNNDKLIHEIIMISPEFMTKFIARQIIDLVRGSEWVSVEDELPRHGQEIVGFAYCKTDELGAHGTWDEIWDKDEPIGAMTHWIPIPSPTNKGE